MAYVYIKKNDLKNGIKKFKELTESKLSITT